MASSDRFFPATILGGHLHVRGIPDWGPWDPARFEWGDEEFVDFLLSKDPVHRKARTREELEAVMKEPKGVPSREVWMHESLEDEGAARKPIHPVGESPTRGVAQLAAVVLSGV